MVHFWEQVLKKDISSSRLRALAPMISGSAGVDYMRKAFASRFNVPAVMPASVSDIAQKLPRTAAWIGEVEASLEQDREEFETSVATVRANLIQGNGMTAGLPPLPSMRTGGRLGAGGFLSHTDRTAASVGKIVFLLSNDNFFLRTELLLTRTPVHREFFEACLPTIM